MHRFYHPDDNTLVGRDVLLSAFFTQHPFPEPVAEIEKVFDHWLALVPTDKIEWSLVGARASSYKKFTTATLKKCREQLDPGRVKEERIAAFELRGGEDKHNPSFAFSFVGAKPGGKTPDKTCLVEIRWPSEFVSEFGADKFVGWIQKLGELLPYRSAYASPALTRGWENSAHVREGARHMTPLAFRHPGYDLPENQATTSFMGPRQCRGARWLTLLGPDLIKSLGGRGKLEKKLDKGIEVVDAGAGVLIRAGTEPEIGDVNQGDNTPLLRSVAAAIEPVTYFEDWRSLGDLFDDDEERLLLWERRHLD